MTVMGLLTLRAELSTSGTVHRLAMIALAVCAIAAAAPGRADEGRHKGLRLDADPPFVDFGKQPVSGTSAYHQVTVTNQSDQTRTIIKVRATAGFGQGNDCGTLKPHAKCTI